MILLTLTVFAALWLLCSFLAYGVALADFQRSYPSIAAEFARRDVGHAVMVSPFGPISLLVALLLSGFAEHGFLLIPESLRRRG